MLLSSDSYTGQNILLRGLQVEPVPVIARAPSRARTRIVSGGETGTIGPNGDVREDRVPTFGKLAPVRYAYLGNREILRFAQNDKLQRFAQNEMTALRLE